jgi:hypothetical protein
VAVVAEAEEREVEAPPRRAGGLAEEGSKELLVRARGRLGLVLAADPVHVRGRDRDAIEERRARHAVVRRRVVGRHAALVAPESVDARPVDARGDFRGREELIEEERRRPAREGDREPLARSAIAVRASTTTRSAAARASAAGSEKTSSSPARPSRSIASTSATRRTCRSAPENLAARNVRTSSAASSGPTTRTPMQRTFMASCSTP